MKCAGGKLKLLTELPEGPNRLLRREAVHDLDQAINSFHCEDLSWLTGKLEDDTGCLKAIMVKDCPQAEF